MPDQACQVYFDHDSQNPGPTGANWTWNVAITNVSMANITQAIAEAQVAFVDYRFSWNTGGGIESFLRNNQFGSTGPYNPSSVCMYFVWADFPQNVSDRYDGSSADCSDALGPACVQAMKDNMKGTGECETSDFPSIGNPAVRDACADSFGDAGHLGTLAAVLGNSSAPNNVTQLRSNETFAWSLSDPYTPDDRSIFDAETNMLRVIGFSTTNGNVTSNQLLCNRVNNTQARERNVGGRGVEGGAMMVASVGVAAAVAIMLAQM